MDGQLAGRYLTAIREVAKRSLAGSGKRDPATHFCSADFDDPPQASYTLRSVGIPQIVSNLTLVRRTCHRLFVMTTFTYR